MWIKLSPTIRFISCYITLCDWIYHYVDAKYWAKWEVAGRAEAKQVSNLKKYLMQIPNTCAQILRKPGVYCFRGEMPTPNTAERSCKHWILHNALKDPNWNYSLLFYNKVGRVDIYFIYEETKSKVRLVQDQTLVYFWGHDWNELSGLSAHHAFFHIVFDINRYDDNHIINLSFTANEYINIKFAYSINIFAQMKDTGLNYDDSYFL